MPRGLRNCTPFSFGTALPSLSEHRWREPERGRLDSAVEAEMVQKAATKIKEARDPVSVFLSNVGKTALLGMKSQGWIASAAGSERATGGTC